MAFDEEVSKAGAAGRMIGMVEDCELVDPSCFGDLTSGEEDVAEVVEGADVRGLTVEQVEVELAGLRDSAGLFEKTGSLKPEGDGVGFELKTVLYRLQCQMHGGVLPDFKGWLDGGQRRGTIFVGAA